MELQSLIREIPDFPKKGVLFKDITPLLQDASAFRQAVDALVALIQDKTFDRIVCIEARGFVFGGALADRLGIGVVPVRKKGKLPYRSRSVSYALEYGQGILEIHEDALKQGQRVLILDDLLATGGTAKATAELVESFGAKVAAFLFLIELTFLKGRERLKGYPVLSLIQYNND